MDLILLYQAEIDIQVIFNRFEDYRSGRGIRFIAELESALTLLREHPFSGGIYDLPFRRMLVRNFPCGIFYEAQPKRLVVAAVIDLRQNPQVIRLRLFGENAG